MEESDAFKRSAAVHAAQCCRRQRLLVDGAKNEIEKRRQGNFHERWQLLF